MVVIDMKVDEALRELNSLSPETTTRQMLETAVTNYAEAIRNHYNKENKMYYPVYSYYCRYRAVGLNETEPDPMWLEM